MTSDYVKKGGSYVLDSTDVVMEEIILYLVSALKQFSGDKCNRWNKIGHMLINIKAGWWRHEVH